MYSNLENTLLRQQLIICQQSVKRPKLKPQDRLLLVWLSKIFTKWKESLIVVKPETVIGWHRQGFKHYWRWKCRKAGRPAIDWPLIKLIRKLQKKNPIWSHQRIQGELAKLGFSVCNNTVLKYLRKSRPHSQWAIQQLRETFAFDETTQYVIRDNDAIFSEEFKQTIKLFGLEDAPTSPHSPWQNPIAERVNGTLRRECLDHVIILNEKHLHAVLTDYIDNYYNVSRTHMSLKKDSYAFGLILVQPSGSTD